MAGRYKNNQAGKDIAADLAPGDEPVRAEYERDFIPG